ncbi:MAG TPA: outer membrane beta-barrel protein [Rubrobacter sp.]|nr:outer membrane beta-barrel protein [Rubrobacter sp.]
MQGLRRVVLVAGVMAISVTTTGAAQLRFSLGGGVTLPLGTFDDQAGTGWHGMGAIGFQPADFPVGFQVDGMYHRFGFEAAGIDADWQLIEGTANVVFKFKSSEESKSGLYLIGGIGGYNVKAVGDDAEGADSDTNFGVNAGAGFDFALGNLSAFIESRFHAIFSGTVDPETLDDATASYVPITLGIRFGGGS